MPSEKRGSCSDARYEQLKLQTSSTLERPAIVCNLGGASNESFGAVFVVKNYQLVDEALSKNLVFSDFVFCRQ